ncbi:ABC-type amino acid transport substrate-binding protein [Vibrio crassostreae]|nr:ABC-type amino acid transport substrate-binding protein [Vibrio crassostreae]CAK1705955.1 ABC-type amino acid transport substrate-binding protein [Vibrio crassostreae]CAK1724171.1 ABC-type amino acid transport substrate-binding protein [Vibrio crassostreae]CAK1724885.1 ABC-type amino acid transport substrate-binding protein [Vibrio crassostreae]CAK1729161.1 ABC-type amino acid transport substrate-binding protein [Vibrio crassostreae]
MSFIIASGNLYVVMKNRATSLILRAYYKESMTMKTSKTLFLGLLLCNGAYSTTLDVGLMSEGRPPYFIQPTNHVPVSGMYIDILDEISQQTGLEFNYKFLPQKRIRAYIKIGLLDVEPGIAPQWRTKEGEMDTTVYSEPLFESPEVLVYNPSKFPIPPSNEELMQYKSCKVLGFNSVKDANLKEFALTSEKKIIDLIKLQRCDWAVFPIDVLSSQPSFERLKYTDPVATYSLSLRLNKEHAHQLIPINAAIREMKASGKLNVIIRSYTLEQN